jgi:molybdopterin-containing oxidoreductase family membrane subunit
MISLTAFTNLNNAVPWGLWVSIYVWMVGISAGSFALVNYGNLSGNQYLKSVTRLGLSLALATLLSGLLSIQLDLGHIERFTNLFTSPNFGSVMALMVWLYGAYAALLAVSILKLKQGLPKLFSLVFFIFALGIIILESLLFARPPGKHWHSVVFLLHFFFSSLASGIGALLFATGAFWVKEKKKELLCALSTIALPVIMLNLAIELVGVFSSGQIAQLEAWAIVLANALVILLLRRSSSIFIALAGFIELVTVLISKYNHLISGQTVEPFKGFAQSYIEPRLVFRYVPNNPEIIIGVFLVGLAACIFYFLYRILPLTREG